MDWNQFAKEIDGELKDRSTGFVLADTTEKEISKEWEDRQLKIKKKIWRSHGASKHSNVEKLELEYLIKNGGYGKVRIRRKNLLRRIGNNRSGQYEIEGDRLTALKDILHVKELQYLLEYPKSELIILGNQIKFNARSTGEMKEELKKIFDSIETLRHKIEASGQITNSAQPRFPWTDKFQ